MVPLNCVWDRQAYPTARNLECVPPCCSARRVWCYCGLNRSRDTAFWRSGVFGQLQTSLNTIWGVQPKPGRGVLGIVQDRILSFGFILVVGFLLLVSLLLTAAVSLVGQWFGGMVPGMETLAQIVNSILSLALITVLFAIIFKFLPDAKVAWHDVWIGAFITAVLFMVGKLVLGVYLGKSGVSSSYGAAGSLIVLLLWV